MLSINGSAAGFDVHVKGFSGAFLEFSISQSPNLDSAAAASVKLPLSLDLQVGNQDAEPIVGRANGTGDSVHYKARMPFGIFPGVHRYLLWQKKDTIFSENLKFPNPRPQAGQQPIIKSMQPLGGIAGTEITVSGENFGESLSDVYVWFVQKNGKEFPEAISRQINPGRVTYLSLDDASETQQLKFVIPSDSSLPRAMENAGISGILEYEMLVRVVVDGQPSGSRKILSVVRGSYRLIIFGVVMVTMILLLIGFELLSRYVSRGEERRSLKVIDFVTNHETGRLSLAKCQALAWTMVLVVSYLYYACMVYLILDDVSIPDFDASLLILMGISSGGLLIARTQDRTKTASQIERDNINGQRRTARLSDLFYEGGAFSLTRLQLVVFTGVCIAIYIIYMQNPDIVSNGLPTMPDTLLMLMGISQGGYIGGKAVGKTGDEATLNAAQNSGLAGTPGASGAIQTVNPGQQQVVMPSPQPQAEAQANVSPQTPPAPKTEAPAADAGTDTTTGSDSKNPAPQDQPQNDASENDAPPNP
ncbi:MAG: IPT/TIG domain-containing protein [Bacteroidota bacterium]